MYSFKLGTWTFLLKTLKISSFGRSGTEKTLANLAAQSFWFEMEEEVCDFCESPSDNPPSIPSVLVIFLFADAKSSGGQELDGIVKALTWKRWDTIRLDLRKMILIYFHLKTE